MIKKLFIFIMFSYLNVFSLDPIQISLRDLNADLIGLNKKIKVALASPTPIPDLMSEIRAGKTLKKVIIQPKYFTPFEFLKGATDFSQNLVFDNFANELNFLDYFKAPDQNKIEQELSKSSESFSNKLKEQIDLGPLLKDLKLKLDNVSSLTKEFKPMVFGDYIKDTGRIKIVNEVAENNLKKEKENLLNYLKNKDYEKFKEELNKIMDESLGDVKKYLGLIIEDLSFFKNNFRDQITLDSYVNNKKLSLKVDSLLNNFKNLINSINNVPKNQAFVSLLKFLSSNQSDNDIKVLIKPFKTFISALSLLTNNLLIQNFNEIFKEYSLKIENLVNTFNKQSKKLSEDVYKKELEFQINEYLKSDYNAFNEKYYNQLIPKLLLGANDNNLVSKFEDVQNIRNLYLKDIYKYIYLLEKLVKNELALITDNAKKDYQEGKGSFSNLMNAYLNEIKTATKIFSKLDELYKKISEYKPKSGKDYLEEISKYIHNKIEQLKNEYKNNEKVRYGIIFVGISDEADKDLLLKINLELAGFGKKPELTINEPNEKELSEEEKKKLKEEEEEWE